MKNQPNAWTALDWFLLKSILRILKCITFGTIFAVKEKF